MNEALPNPFNVTKADDFSDPQIAAYFVDMPGGGYVNIANPASTTSMLIRGGKGSGKTHIMRYCSYALQKIRGGADFARQIQTEGYLGIYFRCGGLNASRFSGKGQDPDLWNAMFAYYIELWLAQLVLRMAADFCGATGWRAGQELTAAEACRDLLDEDIVGRCNTLSQLADGLHGVQRQLDSDINNVAMTRTLTARIGATPGRLVFGIPQILTREIDSCNGLLFVYLVDEYENLQEEQQKYFNTLVREKERPTAFKIGGRIYGFRTLKTYSADEEIKEGSEYEVLPLDHSLRENKNYPRFARLLCARRLIEGGYAPAGSNPENLLSVLDEAFDRPAPSDLCEAETAFVQKYSGLERPYFQKLADKLKAGMKLGLTPGLSSDEDVENVACCLGRPEYPVLEKINVLRLYQLWRKSADLCETAREIALQCEAFVSGRGADEYATTVSHYKLDMLAQLLRECNQKQRYLGMDSFIAMSEGLPRNLLIILKLVIKWAAFDGERPFGAASISVNSQQAGVKQAAEWFFNDARMPGDEGQAIRDGISRLARLFREVRYSDKPSECSLCSFSADLSSCSARARRMVGLAENWSLLIKVAGGQRDRNSMRVDEKYQLNAMLSPLWDLPVYRRGVLPLGPREVNAIFDTDCVGEFESVIDERTSRMTAPAFGTKDKSNSAEQRQLPLG